MLWGILFENRVSTRMPFKQLIQPSIFRLAVFASTLLLSACKIIQVVPEGGEIISRTGLNDCESGQTCEIDVPNGEVFSDSFIAVPAAGYQFRGWKKADRYLCGGLEAACELENVPGSFTDQDIDLYLEPIFDRDSDGDGVFDQEDAFPLDPNETSDFDADGIGDRSDNDRDNDGVDDLLYLTIDRAFTAGGASSVGILFNIPGSTTTLRLNVRFTSGEFETYVTTSTYLWEESGYDFASASEAVLLLAQLEDISNLTELAALFDGLAGLFINLTGQYGGDDFPFDPSESLDTDSDGIGNNADDDDDGDAVIDTLDAFPLDPVEWSDYDGDGLGNVADPDADNDGVLDAVDAYPTNELATRDIASNNIEEQSIVSDGHYYLDHIRQLAGMTPYGRSTELSAAASNHAYYLSVNDLTGHDESPELAGFTGESSSDRANYAGFNSTSTLENVSYREENQGFEGAIDSLMRAIYHRNSLLRYNVNVIGMGHEHITQNAWVTLAGNREKNRLCNLPSYTGPGRYYFLVCADDDQRVEATLFEAAENDIAIQNPSEILWPAPNSDVALPVFYRETPDPLPNDEVSANPVSVEFNTAFYASPPTVSQFQVSDRSTGEVLPLLTHMTASNDPNGRFNEFQHAIFPVARYDWGGTYDVLLEFEYEGQPTSLSWSFETQSLPYPILTLDRDFSTDMFSGATFVLYAPPEDTLDMDGSYRWWYDNGVTAEFDWVDNHTLIVNTSGRGELRIEFHDKTVTINLI